MKLVVINEYYEMGGAEAIARQQVELLKRRGHEVRMLCFGYNEQNPDKRPDCEGVDFIKIPRIYKTMNLKRVSKRIYRYLKEQNPDGVIVHNVFSSPLSVFQALNEWDVVQIIHDVYSVCPNTLGVYLNSNWIACDCQRGSICFEHCKKYGRIKLCLKLRLLNQLFKIREKMNVTYVAPSMCLVECLLRNDMTAVHLPNPFQAGHNPPCFSEFAQGSPKHFCYVGGVEERKGCFDLCRAFRLLEGNHSLTIYGRMGTEKESAEFERCLEGDKRIKYEGQVDHTELLNNMRLFDFLVVPSKCLENYPTAILDAFSKGVVVIGSNRGGIPELLSDNCGLAYECNDIGGLLQVLRYCSNEMTSDEYRSIQENAYQKIKNSNNPDNYVRALEAILIRKRQ